MSSSVSNINLYLVSLYVESKQSGQRCRRGVETRPVAAIEAIRIRLMTELCKVMKGTGEEEGRKVWGGVKTAARGSASGANTFHLTCFCR